MLKVKPHPEYPPEEGRYLRGNDYSPAAVVIIIHPEGMMKQAISQIFSFDTRLFHAAPQ